MGDLRLNLRLTLEYTERMSSSRRDSPGASVAPDALRPAHLGRQAFWADEQAALEQAEAVALISQQIKFRPKSVISLPIDKKAKHLAGLAQVSDLLAARLLIAYHLEHQRPMMGAFLDLLGIAHEDGLIKDEEPKAPDAETLDKAREGTVGEVSEGRRRALLLGAALAGSRDVGRAQGTPGTGDRLVHRLNQSRDPLPPFDKHLFICCNRREPGHPRGSCDPAGSEALHKAFKKALAERGINRRSAPTSPAASINARKARASSSIRTPSGTAGSPKPTSTRSSSEHIIGGRPVERLLMPDDPWRSLECLMHS